MMQMLLHGFTSLISEVFRLCTSQFAQKKEIAMNKIVCPQCVDKDDMIQKVSALYSGGISTTSYEMPAAAQYQGKTYYGTVQQTATSITELARRLRPPHKPELTGCARYSGGCAILLVLLSLILGIILLETVPKIFHFDDENKVGKVIGIAAFTTTVTLSTALLIIFGKKFDAKKEKELKPKLATWEQAISRWQNLYYCARHDCVFDPISKASVLPERMYELLYR